MLKFTRRTWAEIDLDALADNFNFISQRLGDTKIIATVKADAYGHGEKYIAAELEQLGVNWFSVSNIDEAEALRKHGIKANILILGYTPIESVASLVNSNVTQAIFSTEYAQKLNEQAKQQNLTLPVHIKLDTGMNRIGFVCNAQGYDLDGIKSVYEQKHLRVDGLFTHLSHDDNLDSDAVAFTRGQIKCFDDVITQLKNQKYPIGLTHVQNSAAVLHMTDLHYALARPGIILYGLNPSDQVVSANLKPVMQLKSVITMVKQVPPNTPIGYSRTFTTKQMTKIATVPIGYADGYFRLLSNKGTVLVNGKRASVIGNVCMDQLMIDATDIDIQEGDVVTLFGTDGDLSISATDLADQIGTINYEIVCAISRRVPRVYYKNQTVVGITEYI